MFIGNVIVSSAETTALGRPQRFLTIGSFPVTQRVTKYESICVFSDMIHMLKDLRKDYLTQVLHHGELPPPLRDEDVAAYEAESNKQRKIADKSV